LGYWKWQAEHLAKARCVHLHPIKKDGREMKALEEFMNHMTWWNQLKSSGKIAEFRTYGPMTGDFKRAGFVFVKGSDALKNPADDHSLLVFDPKLRGKTDKFVFEFRKPR
jgi:hypothetical protein